MRKLAILTFQTLDGVMQAPSDPGEDRTGGFDRGGWAAPYWQEVMAQVQKEAMAAPYDILLGRKTYELFAGHHPNEATNNPVSEMLNRSRKYVASNTLKNVEWNNSGIVCGDIPAAVEGLKKMDGPLLQVHGSWELIQTLLTHDLIDEFRLWTFPVLVGGGKKLFRSSERSRGLSLMKSEACSNGAMMSIYART